MSIVINRPKFDNQAFFRFCNKFRIQHVASTPYNLAANILVAFNKTLMKLLRRFFSLRQRDWDEKLRKCFLAYRTMVGTPMKAAPFSLVYKSKVVLPLQIQISSLRIALVTKLIMKENHQWLLQKSEALDNKHPEAQPSQRRLTRKLNIKLLIKVTWFWQ